MRIELIEELPINEDYQDDITLTRRNASTRAEEPATGLLGMQLWFSATEDGSAIDPLLLASLNEAVGKPGTYVNDVIEQASLISKLTSYLGARVYLVVNLPNDLRRSKPLKVVRVRSL